MLGVRKIVAQQSRLCAAKVKTEKPKLVTKEVCTEKSKTARVHIDDMRKQASVVITASTTR